MIRVISSRHTKGVNCVKELIFPMSVNHRLEILKNNKSICYRTDSRCYGIIELNAGSGQES